MLCETSGLERNTERRSHIWHSLKHLAKSYLAVDRISRIAFERNRDWCEWKHCASDAAFCNYYAVLVQRRFLADCDSQCSASNRLGLRVNLDCCELNRLASPQRGHWRLHAAAASRDWSECPVVPGCPCFLRALWSVLGRVGDSGLPVATSRSVTMRSWSGTHEWTFLD